MVVMLLWGCQPEIDYDHLRFLTRASLDLRGVRPSLEEIQAVQANPASDSEWVEQYLQDSRLGTRVSSLFAATYLTQADNFDIEAANYSIPNEDDFLLAMGEEPLRMLGYIAQQDLPYTELMTGDWTMANEVLAEWYPIDYPTGESGWKKVHWTDGRPVAGVLSASGLWWRYNSTYNNANRGRANAVTRIFLCNDYLEQTISVQNNLNLLNDAAVKEAIHTNPSCVGCHQSLDPIGAYFWGFYREFTLNPSDIANYHPDRSLLYERYDPKVKPAFYGQSGQSLQDLGYQIASDPKYIECFTRQSFEKLLQRTATLEDVEQLTAYQNDFIAGGLTIRSLWRAILLSDAYRGRGVAPPVHLLSIDQLVSVLEDLTGYRLSFEGKDGFAYDHEGIRSLAGGGRAVFGAAGSTTATPTATLVYQQVVAAAAAYAITSAQAGDTRLLSIDFTETPENNRDAMEAQLRGLALRFYSRPAEANELNDWLSLWSALYAQDGSIPNAWRGLLSAMLLDPEFLVD